MEDEHVIDHLSVSQIGMYSRCQLQYFFRYIEKIKAPPRTNLVVGSATHKGLESIYRDKMCDGKYSIDVALDMTAAHVENADQLEEIDWDKPKGECVDQSVALVKTYHKEKVPDTIKQEEIEDVEKKITVNIKEAGGDISFNVILVPDLILEDATVDFKTTKSKPYQIDAAYKFQVAFYNTVLDKHKAIIHYLIKTKVPKFISMDTMVTEHIMKLSRSVFLRNYKAISDSIRTGNFAPSGLTHDWICSYCGFARIGLCKYYDIVKE